MGLMQAIELVEDRGTKQPSAKTARAMLEATKRERLLIGLGGLHGNVLRLGPSMLVSEDEVSDCLERLGRACQSVDSSR
jgi:4-aminobutyrate aminotransferase-like enzyme